MKRRISFILTTLGLLYALVSFGQQAPVFTHHYSSLMFSNPGYAGMNEGICINGIYRQQWAGFKDKDGNSVAPQDFLLTLDSPVRLFHGGVGGSIIQDKLGQQSDIVVQLDYSFHTEISFGTLGIGAGLNIINRSIDFTKFNPVVTDDPVLNGLGNESDMRLDASFGLFLTQSGQYYFGISATNLLQTKFKKLDPSGEGITMTDRTFYITGGYNFVFPGNPLFELQPSAMILSDLASTQYNVSAVVKYNDKFWGGINYRVQESIGIMVGMQFKDFRIGYAYDVNTMQISVPGSHEVTLGYCFKIKGDRSKTSYKNTRYL